METKLFEIRDVGTFVPVMCTLMGSETKAEKYLLMRVGYGERQFVLMTILTRNLTKYDPEEWCDRTFQTAHEHIQENWSSLNTGDVIDVEFVLGETHHKKISERCEGIGYMARMGEE